LSFVSTSYNTVDEFTKPLVKILFRRHRDTLLGHRKTFISLTIYHEHVFYFVALISIYMLLEFPSLEFFQHKGGDNCIIF